MNTDKLLKLREEIKAKKPKFLRQEGHKRKKLKTKWRKPKGLDSKMRRGMRGHMRMVREGYASPRKVSGLNKEGLKEIIVSNVNDLKNVVEGCVAVVSGKIGLRKKVVLLKEAEKMKVKVANIADVNKFLKDVEEKLGKKKKESKEKEEKKKKSKEASLKKAGEKKESDKPEEEKKKEDEEKIKKLKKQMATEKAVGSKS